MFGTFGRKTLTIMLICIGDGIRDSLFEFLRFIHNEPKKSRVYSVASCHIPFYQNTMLSTFSQYADVSDNLYRYIETGIRECMNKEI